MFKAFVGKLTCGVALAVAFVACGTGSEEAAEELAVPAAEENADVSAAASERAASDPELAAGEGAEASAEVEASGLVCTECFANLNTCFPVRDAIFEQSRVLCVCQAPDLDDCCSTSTVDLECNL